MGEMVDRVALAILRELAPLHMDSVLSQGLSLKERPCLPNGRAEQVARAAIEAMREPTKEMNTAARQCIWEFSSDYAPVKPDPELRHEDSAESIAKKAWQAMITAAIKTA